MPSASEPQAEPIAVYEGRTFIGLVYERLGGFAAERSDGAIAGIYPSVRDASRALSAKTSPDAGEVLRARSGP